MATEQLQPSESSYSRNVGAHPLDQRRANAESADFLRHGDGLVVQRPEFAEVLPAHPIPLRCTGHPARGRRSPLISHLEMEAARNLYRAVTIHPKVT